MEYRAQPRGIVELPRPGNAGHAAEFPGASQPAISAVGVRLGQMIRDASQPGTSVPRLRLLARAGP
jgi:hypothetical protein